MIESPAGSEIAGIVADQADRMTEEIVALAQALIRFDSVNQPPWGNEGPCQTFVAECLRDLGATVEQFTPDEVPGLDADPAYLRGRDYTNRPNVVGMLDGSGGGRSLHLAAHADVVPIGDRTQWTVEPFGALIKDGKIYGRGAVDDRDGLTGLLAAPRVIQRAGLRFHGDLILSSYVDEEFAGGNGLLAIVRKGYRGEAAINCDGVGFVMGVANTGGGPFRVLIQSQAEAAQLTPSMRQVLAACREHLARSERSVAEVLAPSPLSCRLTVDLQAIPDRAEGLVRGAPTVELAEPWSGLRPERLCYDPAGPGPRSI